MPMSALSPQIAEASRKTERVLLQTLAERSQVKVAELQKQFIQATEAMQALSARLELLTTGVRHLRSAA